MLGRKERSSGHTGAEGTVNEAAAVFRLCEVGALASVPPTNEFGPRSQPSSDFKFGYLGNRGHTAGTVSACSVPSKAIKAYQVSL